MSNGLDIVQINGVSISDDRLEVETKQKSGETDDIILVDDSSNRAQVTPAGELKVFSAVIVPPTRTPVVRVFRDEVDGNDTEIDTWTIPNGETVIIQIMQGGAEDYSNASRITLYYAPNGTLDGNEVILSCFYIPEVGGSDHETLGCEYTGDGTKAIILERKRLGAGAIEVYARWQGYY